VSGINSESNSPLRVSPYARISDTDEERAPGLDRQLRTVHPLIASRDAVLTRDYTDNDKSAYKPDVFRDDFEAWLQDFIDDKTDGIAAWDLDRVFRQNTDLERVIKEYCDAYLKQKRPKPVLWLPSMTLDLTDPNGQTIARMLVAVANQSSAKTVKRVTDFYRDEALKGNIFSNYPAFYRNKDGSINAEQAAITFKAIEDVFAGVRPTAIADEWRSKGIMTARGGRVSGETVRRILIDPGIAGLAVYRKELLTGTDGEPIKRTDGGLTDEATWRAVCKELETKPGRRRKPTKALYSKFLRCGLCGSRMVRTRKTDTYFTYACQSVDAGGCARVAISGPKLDKQLTAADLELFGRVLAESLEPVLVGFMDFEGRCGLEALEAPVREVELPATRGRKVANLVIAKSVLATGCTAISLTQTALNAYQPDRILIASLFYSITGINELTAEFPSAEDLVLGEADRLDSNGMLHPGIGLNENRV
jgi:site-specific DNA recombinase